MTTDTTDPRLVALATALGEALVARDEAWIERDACCASLREAKAALDRDRGALLQIFGATPPAPLDTFDGNIANHVINVMLTLLAERDEARAELARLRDGGEE